MPWKTWKERTEENYSYKAYWWWIGWWIEAGDYIRALEALTR